MKIDRRHLDAYHLVALGTGLGLGGIGGYLLGRVLAKRKAEEAANWRIASETESARQHYLARESALRNASANIAGKGDNPDQRAATALGDAKNVAESGTTAGSLDASRADAGAGSAEDDDGDPGSKKLLREIFTRERYGDTGPDSPLVGLPGTGTQDDDYSLEDDQDGGEDGADPDDGEHSGPEQLGPHVITYEEFSEEYLTARKLTVTYYADDNVLCDERDVPFNDRLRTVGVDFFEHFGEVPNEPNVVYVRNRRIDIDFEIVRNLGSYKEVVLGYGKPQ